MSVRDDPVLGGWYRDFDEDQTFQVVVYDEADGVVEIQYADGDVRALELDEWYGMDVEAVSEPDELSVENEDDEDDDARRSRRRGLEDEDILDDF